MRALPFVLLVSTLAFGEVAAADEAGVTNDPNNTERLQFSEEAVSGV